MPDVLLLLAGGLLSLSVAALAVSLIALTYSIVTLVMIKRTSCTLAITWRHLASSARRRGDAEAASEREALARKYERWGRPFKPKVQVPDA